MMRVTHRPCYEVPVTKNTLQSPVRTFFYPKTFGGRYVIFFLGKNAPGRREARRHQEIFVYGACFPYGGRYRMMRVTHRPLYEVPVTKNTLQSPVRTLFYPKKFGGRYVIFFLGKNAPGQRQRYIFYVFV